MNGEAVFPSPGMGMSILEGGGRSAAAEDAAGGILAGPGAGATSAGWDGVVPVSFVFAGVPSGMHIRMSGSQ